MDELRVASSIARDAHEGQSYDGGSYFDRHVVPVVRRVLHQGDDAQIVAYLHDAVEDTSVTQDELRRAGIGTRNRESISMLTRDPNLRYDEYVDRLIESANRTALIVKEADLLVNIGHATEDYYVLRTQSIWLPTLARVVQARVRLGIVV